MNGQRAQIPIRDSVLAWVGAWLVGSLAAGAVLGASGSDTVAEAGPGWLVGLSVAQWLPMLAVVWMLGRRFGVGSPTRDYGFTLRPIDAVGVPIGIATQLLFVPLLYLPLQSAWPKTFESDDVEKRARELWEGASGAGVVLLVLIVAVGAPLVEELIYRGLLQGAVGRRLHHWRGWLAVILVAAMFALVHFAPIEYPGLFLVGLILGACTLRTGRLGMSVLAHAAFNATGLALVAAS